MFKRDFVSCQFIIENLVVDNDGMHGMVQVMGAIELAKGYHTIKVTFFEKDGQDDLKVYIKEPGMNIGLISDDMLFYKAPDDLRTSDQ